MKLNKGLEAAVLLAQGVLAGLTLASVYTMVLADSLESFVAAYEVRASSHAGLLVLLAEDLTQGLLFCETALRAKIEHQ